jgi:hypothetical protein
MPAIFAGHGNPMNALLRNGRAEAEQEWLDFIEPSCQRIAFYP